MATAVDTLVTRYVADTKDYEAGNRRVAGLTDQLAQKMPNVADAAAKVAAALVAMNGAILGFGVAAFRQFAEFDALTKSLLSIEGSAYKAERAMRMLRDVAKLPGLGLEEAISGYSGLRMGGLNEAQGERVLRATGNANALMGGGRDQLARVLLAIQQIITRPNLSGEELNQLAEARIPARQALLESFGTADTEELKRRGITSGQALEAIITQLERLPEAANGPKNALENLEVAMSQATVQIGGAIAERFLPVFEQMSGAIERAVDSEAFGVIGDAIANLADSLGLGAAKGQEMSDTLADVIGGVATFIDALAMLNRWLDTVSKTGIMRLLLERFGNNIVGTNRSAEVRARMGGTAVSGLVTGAIDAALGGGQNPSLAGVGGGGSPAAVEADRANRQAVNHLAAIESNTRAMVDLQRHILGGGNIGAMGVTPIELSDIRRGGTGEEMVMSGIRKMMMELGVSSFGRRGMVR